MLSSSLFTGSSLFIGSTLLFLSARRRYLHIVPFPALTTISLTRNRSMTSKTLSIAEQVAYWESRDHENSYLEEVHGEKALNWVKSKNSHCLSHFGDPTLSPIYNRTLSILESKDKIPYVEKIGSYYYNYWKDDQHLRGIWRRTTFESYCTPSPNWEIVLDVDELGRKENQSWVYVGHDLLELDPTIIPTRTLIYLSPGGSDAKVVREFDLETCQFVEDGFVIPEGKSNVCWKARDTLLVGTDFKDGSSMTLSGYPRVVHEWNRGTPLSASTRVYEGNEKDVNVHQVYYSHCGSTYEYRVRSLTFYTSLYSIKRTESGDWQDISLPEDVEISFFRNLMLITTRSDWTVSNNITYPAGSLISVSIEDFLEHGIESTFTVLFQPNDTISLDSTTKLQTYVILTVLDDIKTRLVFWEYCADSNNWVLRGQEPNALIRGTSLWAYDSEHSNKFWISVSSFLTPSRLYLLDAEDGIDEIQHHFAQEPLKSLPAFFDASDLVESQYFTISSDGTRVPYFILHSKNMNLNSQNKTLLYGYGGFEVSLLPSYNAIAGATWLTSGTNATSDTVYVIANIRGGGEYGPRWHQAALKEKRSNCYNDFIAVAEDLIQRKITSPSYLAIRGGSNGGLLMGNMMILRPDLFQSVICQVPLLDMKRYSHLLAGASWMAEYGDPDIPEQWKYLQHYSAYHNINSTPNFVATRYPYLLMMTSTKDDRVHPYHARSFIARLDSLGDKKHWYYENIEGGHGGAADNKQQAYVVSLYTEFLFRTLGSQRSG